MLYKYGKETQDVLYDSSKNMYKVEMLIWTNNKAYENVRCFKPCGYLLYYSSENYFVVIFELIICYWTSSSNGNFIHSYGFNHHQFCEFLSEVETEYPDFYHTAVLTVWLWFFSAQEQNWELLNKKNSL